MMELLRTQHSVSNLHRDVPRFDDPVGTAEPVRQTQRVRLTSEARAAGCRAGALSVWGPLRNMWL